MYLDYYKLTEPPFLLTPDPKFLYLSKAHSRAITFMEYAVMNCDGFAVITGEVGSGKTTLISKLLMGLDEDTIIARIYHTHVDSIEFMQSLLEEFGIKNYGDTKVSLISQINNYLIDSYAANKKIILIIDEAQNLSDNVLEEIRLLTDLETNNEKLMNLILVGQPELNDTLDQPHLEQLVQRIRFRFHIGPLSELEMDQYICHRLKVAGARSDIFTRNSIPVLFEYSGGIPRLINALCDVVLICGAAEGKKSTDDQVVHTALGELEWKPFDERYKNHEQKIRPRRGSLESGDHDFNELNSRINKFIKAQSRYAEEMKHILTRLEVKLDAHEDKLISLVNEIRSEHNSDYLKQRVLNDTGL